MIFYLLIVSIVVLCVYRFIIYPQNHWKRKQIEYLKPRFLFGNFTKNFFLQKSFTEIVGDLYKKSKDNHRYVGAYHFTQPLLMICDLDLIKQITVKDFSHFTDHRTFINEDNDDLFGKNLFSLRGKKWKHMRSTLSPAFTGSKMRTMLPLIIECCERFSQYFENQIKESNKNYVDLEMKNAMTRITNDVIASVAFGIKCDSLSKPNNHFYLMGKEISNFGNIKFFVKFLLLSLVPSLVNIFKIKIFDAKLSKYFRGIILDTMELREKNNIIRPDMIQLLMEAKKGKLKSLETSELNNNDEDEITFTKKDHENETFNLDDDDIVAQALLFFIAGFETTSVLMCFALHEIALNTDVQRKLQTEIDEVMKANNNVLTYEVIMKMTYLDMVINETLRLWPPVAAIDRICVKPYTILPDNEHEKPLNLEEGTVVWIPVVGFHSDEKYFKDANKFDPERFSEENKSNINQNSFLPFGVGPRNCIGSRFALIETKIIIIKILSKFDVEPMSKTQNPIRLKKSSITLNAEKGFWIRFKTRNV